MRITATVTAKGGLKGLADRIKAGAFAGLFTGGTQMATVCEATANDMARYPTGELESTIKYEPLTNSGSVITGQVTAGTDHAVHFHEGAAPHFVPAAEADPRIVAGLYSHIIPVYKNRGMPGGVKAPVGSYNAPNNVTLRSSDDIIGYIASSGSHPFLSDGFIATYESVVVEVANQIEEYAGM